MTSLDLTALADDVRRDVPSLDAMLPDDDATRDDRELLALSAAYVDRVSRIAWGVALFVPIAITLACLASTDLASLWPNLSAHARYFDTAFSSGSWWLGRLDDVSHALVVVSTAAISTAVATRAATARFVRITSSPDPIAAARYMVARVDSWSIACWTIGLVAFGVFYGTVIPYHIVALHALRPEVVGVIPADYLATAHESFVAPSRIRDIVVLVLLVVGATAWVVRRRPVWLMARNVAWLALAAALFAPCAAVTTRRLAEYANDGVLTYGVSQTFIAVAGAFALFVAVSAFALQANGRKSGGPT